MVDDVIPLPDGLGGDAAVTVMWRPGCPFCALLLSRLERTGLAFERVDIWEQPSAAAWVRTVADGNETVPTVRIGGYDGAVALVNPSATQVLEAVQRLAPEVMPSADDRPPGPAARLAARLAALLGRAGLRGRRGPDRGHGAQR
jgi:glutaredoxin-like protein